MKWILVAFGWSFVLVVGALVIIPYLKKRADLLTSWNIFLLGSINFVAISAIQSGTAMFHHYGGGYFDDEDYIRFVAGGVIFYTVGILTYRFFKLPRRLAANSFRNWAPQTTPFLVMLLVVCGIMMIGNLFPLPVQFVGQLWYFFGISAAIFAMVFSLVAWDRHRINVVLFLIFAASLLFAILISVSAGYGRRNMLSTLMSLVICAYWLRFRYKSPLRFVVPAAGMAAAAIVVIGGLSLVRQQFISHEERVRTVWQMVQRIPGAFLERGDWTRLFGGDTTEASLVAIDRYTKHADPEPFYTLWYVAVHPIPRAWWPDKPQSFGDRLPRDVGWVRKTGAGNWGPGIIGHGYHEGGLHMLAFYGFFFACFFRFWDEILVRENNNPFVLGILCSVSGQTFALARGDVGLFFAHILGGWVTGILLNIVARSFFGSTVTEPQDDGYVPPDEPDLYGTQY